MTPRAWLIAAGEALYGDRWQSAIAADLGVAVRTVQRWAAGERGVDADTVYQVRALLRDRAARIATLKRTTVDDVAATANSRPSTTS